MRIFVPVLSTLIVLISAASGAATSESNGIMKIELGVEYSPRQPAAIDKNAKRSLRQHEFDDVTETEHDERGGIEKVDDVVSKLDDVVGKARKAPSKFNALITKHIDDIYRSALVKKLSEKYPVAEDLSISTLRQLAKIESGRLNGATFSKTKGGGMRKKIEPFEGIKIAPQKYLEPKLGRKEQLYGADGSRLLSAAVISRSGSDDVLLISSSKHRNDWLLPKGGWDKGEEIEMAALREVIEEAGIQAGLKHNLGEFIHKDGGETGYKLYAYSMENLKTFDDWVESARDRIRVPIKDAKKLVARRPWMVKILDEAEKKNALVKSGQLPEKDPKLTKFELDLKD